MLGFPRYSHHSRTGRLVHHRETSYALLMFVTLLAGVLLGSVTWSATADTDCGINSPRLPSPTYNWPSTPECQGSIAVTAVVSGPRPNRPAIIDNPRNGQVFDTNPITVEGSCPDKALIKIFSNGILVGSVLCQGGRFKIPVDLMIGKNILTAVPYNTLDEEGPTSPGVEVTLNVPPGGVGIGGDLILKSVSYYRGIATGQEVEWPVEIVGGQGPYAVRVDWSDGTSDLITRAAPGPFTVKHVYEAPGTEYLNSYPLIIRASDAVGHTAYLQLTTIVNSPTGAATPAKPKGLDLWFLWPLWIAAVLMIISFWLGEWREKRLIRKKLAGLGGMA